MIAIEFRVEKNDARQSRRANAHSEREAKLLHGVFRGRSKFKSGILSRSQISDRNIRPAGPPWRDYALPGTMKCWHDQMQIPHPPSADSG
jgi:hypothetical protein